MEKFVIHTCVIRLYQCFSKKIFKRDLFINKKDEVYIYVESGKSFVDYVFFRKLCY